MSYTPTVWHDGDTITAEAMNKIEQGIVNAATIITMDTDTLALDKTFTEIFNLLANKIPCYIELTSVDDSIEEDYVCWSKMLQIVQAFKYDANYRVYALNVLPQNSAGSTTLSGVPSIYSFSAETASDNPVFYRQAYVNSSYMSTTTSWGA